eukprot:2707207-Pyramimonas_sp.AAC.1
MSIATHASQESSLGRQIARWIEIHTYGRINIWLATWTYGQINKSGKGPDAQSQTEGCTHDPPTSLRA